MQTENWSLKKIIERPTTKWVIIPSSLLLILVSSLFWGLKSHYDFQENDKNQVVCVFTLSCSPNQSPIDAHPGDGDVLIEPLPINPEGARIKPLSGAIASGVVTVAAVAALTALGIIALPAEMILLAGAVVSSGTYFVLKGF